MTDSDVSSLIAVAALALLFYTYVGYPLLAMALARLVEWAPRLDETYRPTLSVCMAIHNGEPFVGAKIASLQRLQYPPDRLELVIYCDGCSDRTVEIVLACAERDPRIRAIVVDQRLGKPTALNRMREAATGEVLVLTDVRPPLAPEAATALVGPLADPTVGCVSGNLVLAGNSGSGAYWKYEKLIRGSEARIGGLVGVSGTIYAIRRRDFPELPPDIILDDMWVPLTVALERRARIAFSERAAAFEQAFDDDREFGRKARTLAGNYQLLARKPQLLIPFVNPVWFEMVSHKLLRLVCPWALAVLFVASAHTLAEPSSSSLWWGLLFAQLTFYGLAVVGAAAGRAGSLARTFVVLNAAAVVGLWRFIRGRQGVTW
jgi:biofilm PGA synthesis N-glycosyltransferase PgaC